MHWGTGNTGRLALRGIIQHPDLELVGLHVHIADKVGRDAGELAGLRRRPGVIATERSALIADSTPTASATWATGSDRVGGAVEEMSRFLAAGRNVVTTSLNDLVYPARRADRAAMPLEDGLRGRAARRSSTTAPTPASAPTWCRSRCSR